jgi:hypothetical protein
LISRFFNIGYEMKFTRGGRSKACRGELPNPAHLSVDLEVSVRLIEGSPDGVASSKLPRISTSPDMISPTNEKGAFDE